MYTLLLGIAIILALTLTLKRNGIGSFVTLGIIGAAIYSIPALIDTQASLATLGRPSQIGFVAVPPDVELVVVIAWAALLAGLALSAVMFRPRANRVALLLANDKMNAIAVSCAFFAVIGCIYLAYSQHSFLFFLEAREDQNSGAVSTLWRWTGVMGILAASLANNRKLLLFNGLMVAIVFLRGDRTMVAIATAGLVIVASSKRPDWWKRLRPLPIAGMVAAAAAVFFGKSIYLTVKSGLSGEGWGVLSPYSYSQLFLFQFEPTVVFSHLEFVMRTGVTISPLDFLESVLGNLLVVPSAFGISTNLYNQLVTSQLSASYTSGIAGNYIAHGYTVGGTFGSAAFYFILPLMLGLCDSKFRSGTGMMKLFWCCVGATFAFYIHRNGLDNIFSFVRQIFIVSVTVAAGSAAVRHLAVGRPTTFGSRDSAQFVLSPEGARPSVPIGAEATAKRTI